MRGVLAAVVALGIALAPARLPAQERADDPLAPARLDPLQLDRAYTRAKWRRNVGIGLTAPGMALSILGAVLIVYGTQDPNLFGGGAEIASGSVSAGIGLALAVPGVVLWVTGQDDMDVVSWRKLQLTQPGR